MADKSCSRQPWVEKYRPRCVDDIVDHDELKQVLRGSQRTGHLPHLLFYGPPGTGKTSTILALARALVGDRNVRDRVLELNASDERGLSVVCDKIKTFSKVSVSNSGSCYPLKLVILDEADTMTADAQSALRRTMETHAAVTRFCLVCNYPSKIIAPLSSRCAKFRFSAVDPALMKRRLLYICERECVVFEQCSGRVLGAIVESSRGDMRKAVNLLQTVSQQLPRATPSEIAEVAGEVPAAVVGELWSAVVGGSIGSASVSFQATKDAVVKFVAEGYAVGKIFPEIQRRVVLQSTGTPKKLSDRDRARVCLRLLRADRRLNDGADEELQLLDVCCLLQRVYLNNSK